MKLADIGIPTSENSLPLVIETGRSTVFLGANGGGKTRLGVYLDTTLGKLSHRVGAQRALQFKAAIQLIDLDSATEKLHFGTSRSINPHLKGDMLFQQKQQNRYGNNPATSLLTDYEVLLQALFAEENLKSIKFRQASKGGIATEVPETCFDRLQDIWKDLLPHRTLVVLDASIKVDASEGAGDRYDATDLSDGERVILYLVGQSLLLPPNSILIIDEPELHVHRGLMTKLWDALEAARHDCAFIYVTHDLEFAASRLAAQKYALHGYFSHPNPYWDIEPLPADIGGIPEEIVCRIVGSRQPILFIEGDSGSDDISVYRRVYASHTVIPVGGCEAVIGSVASFKAHAELHRVNCSGIVDADDRSEHEINSLNEKDIFTTPVSEIENLFLLPNVFSLLAQTLGHDAETAEQISNKLSEKILDIASKDIEQFALRYTKRRIDRALKTVGLASKNHKDLAAEFSNKINSIDPLRIFTEASEKLQKNIAAKDVESVLSIYDNKGLIAHASPLLGMGMKGLVEHIGRMLRSEQGKSFLNAVRAKLPKLPTPEKNVKIKSVSDAVANTE